MNIVRNVSHAWQIVLCIKPKLIEIFPCFSSEISQLKMVDDQPDASGKYGMNGRGPHGAAKYWPSIFKVIEMVSKFLIFHFSEKNSIGRENRGTGETIGSHRKISCFTFIGFTIGFIIYGCVCITLQ